MRFAGYFMAALMASAIVGIPLQANETVRRAQRHLAVLGYYKGTVDGDAGSMTGAAVRRYQIAEKLKVTGELNKQTLERMGLDAPAPAPEYKAIQALFRGGPLSKTDAATQVEALRSAQLKLTALGHYSGAPNGLPGAAMTAAIKEWQQAHGLQVSGLLDGQTLSGLGLSGSIR